MLNDLVYFFSIEKNSREGERFKVIRISVCLCIVCYTLVVNLSFWIFGLADWRCRCGRRSRWWLEGRGGGGVDGRGGGSSSSRIDEKSIVLRQDYSSAKIKAVIEIIQEHCRPGISYRCNGGSENASSSSGHAELEGLMKAIGPC